MLKVRTKSRIRIRRLFSVIAGDMAAKMIKLRECSSLGKNIKKVSKHLNKVAVAGGR